MKLISEGDIKVADPVVESGWRLATRHCNVGERLRRGIDQFTADIA